MVWPQSHFICRWMECTIGALRSANHLHPILSAILWSTGCVWTFTFDEPVYVHVWLPWRAKRYSAKILLHHFWWLLHFGDLSRPSRIDCVGGKWLPTYWRVGWVILVFVILIKGLMSGVDVRIMEDVVLTWDYSRISAVTLFDSWVLLSVWFVITAWWWFSRIVVKSEGLQFSRFYFSPKKNSNLADFCKLLLLLPAS